jgi:hypothetical protein
MNGRPRTVTPWNTSDLSRRRVPQPPGRDPDSLLSCFQRMLDRLRESAGVGVGGHEVIDVGLPQVSVHRHPLPEAACCSRTTPPTGQ